MTVPKYPAHLTAEERGAVLTQAARNMAADTIREGGFDPARIDQGRVEAEAAMQVVIAWLTERVAALEAEVEARKSRKGKGAAP